MTTIQQTDSNTRYVNYDNNSKKSESVDWKTRVIVITLTAAAIIATVVIVAKIINYLAENAIASLSNEKNFEEMAAEKTSRAFVEEIKSIKKINTKLVLRRISKCNASESFSIKYLERNYSFTDKVIEKIISGANFIIDAEAYQTWSRQPDVVKRFSSHPSNGPQYAIRGIFVREMLFYNYQGKTHVQWESHSCSLKYLVEHTWAYFIYKFTGKNQGPYGSSEYIDRNAFLLEKHTI